jgi:ChrB, C-terminal domain
MTGDAADDLPPALLGPEKLATAFKGGIQRNWQGEATCGHQAVIVEEGDAMMRWITRENIKVDRVACPWLIKRFVDHEAEFIFVPEGELPTSRDRSR